MSGSSAAAERGDRGGDGGLDGTGRTWPVDRGEASAVSAVSAERSFEGEYGILERIGKGSFSIVHKAVELATGDIYAVKVRQVRTQNPFPPSRPSLPPLRLATVSARGPPDG